MEFNRDQGLRAGAVSIFDPLLTAREGAQQLQISEPTFWRWVATA